MTEGQLSQVDLLSHTLPYSYQPRTCWLKREGKDQEGVSSPSLHPCPFLVGGLSVTRSIRLGPPDREGV